ncbi:hypothetical protein R1sor_011583 [Riccia sorocarpa]|uniref:Uncharacterized protein n=1 Tax=Riccia sorocarpa TaxID=122646 RepID=A0ABD3I411_9MARC
MVRRPERERDSGQDVRRHALQELHGRGERQRLVRPRRRQAVTHDIPSESSDDEGRDSPPPAPAAPAAPTAAGAARIPRRRNSEGASLVPYQVTPDAELYLKWGWVRSDDIQPTLDTMDDHDVVRLGFVTLLGLLFQQPHFAACLEFIRSYSLDTHTGTVGGTVVALSRQVVRDTFGLRYGLKPMDIKIRHERIEDWFPVRDTKGKRYLAGDCAWGPQWAPFMQLLNMILLPRRRIKCIPAHLIFLHSGQA